MTATFGTAELLLNLASWRQDTIDPSVTGKAGAIGSFQMQSGAYPLVPDTLYLKLGGNDTDWVRQNLVNLNVFNVADPVYGATGDGATDDTAAIQAAINACNTAGGGIVYFPPVNVAGGKFYKITRQGGAAGNWCLDLRSVANITFLGDGFASKVNIVDANANQLSGFYIAQGGNGLRFRNFQISGEGISVPGPGTPAPLKDLIRVTSETTDVIVGTGRVTVEEMHWGTTPGTRVAVQGMDSGHVVTRVRYRYNLSTADCYYGFAIGNSTINLSFADGMMCEYSWFSSSTGVFGYGLNTDDYGSLFSCVGVICENTSGSGRALQPARGLLTHSIVSNGGAVSINQAYALRPIIRGCVIESPFGDNNGGAETHAITLGRFDSNRFDCQIIGCVVLMTGSQTNSIAICPNSQTFTGILVADNVVSMTNPANQNSVILLSSGNPDATASGNIVMQTANGVNIGLGIEAMAGGGATTQAVSMVGNMCLGITNPMSVGCRQRAAGAADAGNIVISDNLINSTDTGISFSKTAAQLFTGNRAVNCNNVSGLGTSTVVVPGGNAGVSGDGSGGSGTKIAVVNATPTGNVTAVAGSLCCDTAGSQATALQYKESGAGTTLWLGVGEGNFTMGALLGSTATANRFFATGSLALAVETATEIQLAAPRAMFVRNLRLNCGAGTGGDTNTYRLRKNGVDSALTVDVLNTATSGSDTTASHAVSFAVGDKVSSRVSKSLAPTTPQTNIILSFGVY